MRISCYFVHSLTGKLYSLEKSSDKLCVDRWYIWYARDSYKCLLPAPYWRSSSESWHCADLILLMARKVMTSSHPLCGTVHLRKHGESQAVFYDFSVIRSWPNSFLVLCNVLRAKKASISVVCTSQPLFVKDRRWRGWEWRGILRSSHWSFK